jgi:hypothetical protein
VPCGDCTTSTALRRDRGRRGGRARSTTCCFLLDSHRQISTPWLSFLVQENLEKPSLFRISPPGGSQFDEHTYSLRVDSVSQLALSPLPPFPSVSLRSIPAKDVHSAVARCESVRCSMGSTTIFPHCVGSRSRQKLLIQNSLSKDKQARYHQGD